MILEFGSLGVPGAAPDAKPITSTPLSKSSCRNDRASALMTPFGRSWRRWLRRRRPRLPRRGRMTMSRDDRKRAIGKVVSVAADRFVIEMHAGTDNFTVVGFDDVHYVARLGSFLMVA